jgi:uroporphyrinogen decarboxylase
MTSRERMQLALNHKEADRVPYDLAGTTVTGICKGAFLNAMKERGLSTEFDTAECDPISQIVTPVEETLVALKSDTRRIGARRIMDYEKIRTYDDKGTAILTDLYDCEWRMSTHELYYSQATYPLKKYDSITEGLEHWKVPAWGPEQIAKMEADIAPLAKQIGDYCGIADRNCAGLTEMSTRIRGHEAWYMDVYMDPDGVDALAQQFIEHKKEYWASLFSWIKRNNLADKILVASECDDLGTQASTLIDPNDLRTYIIPKFKDLFGFIKQEMPGIKTFMHSCGSIRPIIPDLIDAGLDILNPVQFTATDMELTGLKRDFGKDLVFWGGGIDTQSTLCKGTPQEVSDEVKRILDIMAPGGGFVFAPVHNIQDDVSAANFWAMWDTVMEYGKYK